MITKLTKKQENLIITHRDEWIDRMYSCKNRTDRKQAIKYINWLYEFCGYKKPIIIFLDSPLAMHVGTNALVKTLQNVLGNKKYSHISSKIGFEISSKIGSKIGSEIRSQIRSQIYSEISSKIGSEISSKIGSEIRSQIRSQIYSQIRSQIYSQIGSQIYSQIRSQIYSQIRSQIGSQIYSQIGSQIYSEIDSQIRSQIYSEIDVEYYSGYEGTTWHWGYYAWLDYYQQAKILPKTLFKEFNNLIALCKANIYDMIQLDGLCVVSDMPTKISVDSQYRLHNEQDMAIQWSDGYGGYFINGTRVTEKIVKTPEKLTKSDWEKESNLEIRRVIQDRMPNFVKKLGAVSIQSDSCGELLEVSLPSDPEKIARYVHVKDSSTDRKYYLRVPPTIKTCKEGVAWTFGIDNEVYKPVIET